jgi:TolB-like protein
VLTRAELATRLWGSDTFVDAAAGLNTAVAKLREALGDQADQPIYIETVPKRGYRFVGTIDRATTTPVLAQPPGVGRLWIAVAAMIVALIAVGAYRLRAGRPQTRVAVILFDNETGRPEVSRLSQGLTDATVFALTADPKLAVIGNAAELRTPRPFRDIALVRDALHADFIVVGQVQTVDGRILVRSHLIRAADEAHVWVNAARMEDSEAALQSTVSSRIAAAVASKTQPAR